jgi:2-methylcitrate dehydratase PrpD
MLETLHIDTPTQGFGGKFSLRFCVAAAFADGRVDLDTFTEESLERRVLQELMARVEVRVTPGGRVAGPERSYTPVEVHLRDGRSEARQCNAPRGNVANRMTRAEIVAKFEYCATRALPSASVAGALALLGDLEHHRVRELMDAIAHR